MTTATSSLDPYSSLGLRTSADTVAAAAAASSDPHAQKMDFLTLMTEQIKHQNPLNPLDGQDFLAQLAQFSVVEQTTKLNDSFANLAAKLTSDQSLQAASLIGRQARVTGDQGALTADQALSGAAVLDQTAGSVRVNFYDPAGQLVRGLDLGPQAPGEIPFSWDGTGDNGQWAGAGTYRVEVVAQTGAGAVALPTQIDARVEGVSLGGSGGVTLDLAGIGPVALTDIQRLR